MSKPGFTVLARAVLVAAALAGTIAAASDAPTAAESSQTLATGLTPTAELLQLMDTDNNGKVSKAEFLRFMEAEFDYADKNQDHELDPRELRAFVRSMSHPRVNGPGR